MPTYTAETPRLTGLTERTFGVELELGFKSGPARTAARVSWSSVRERVLEAFREADIPVRSESYNHEARPHWKFVTDGSIGMDNIELVSPILKGEEGLRAVERVCAVLSRFFPFVDERMGLHVHHGAHDLTIHELRVLARLVTRFKSVFDGLVPPSRRNNHFCRHFGDYDLRTIDQARDKRTLGGMDRYRALNFAALSRHGTVEFRQHSGTFEAKKIVGWIMLTQGLVEKSKHGRGRKFDAGAVAANGDGFNNLVRAAGLRSCIPHAQRIDPRFEERVRTTVAYLRERATKFRLINLSERSEVRSRATRTAAERVAEATTPETATPETPDATQ